MNVQHSARRILLAGLVLGIGLVHLLDLPGKWSETRWMGVAYVLLIGACVACADLLLRGDDALTLLIAAGVALGPLAGFVLTRTVGLPGATGDVGNWTEPLGLASVFVEGVTLMIAAAALSDRPVRRSPGAHAEVPAPRAARDATGTPAGQRTA